MLLTREPSGDSAKPGGAVLTWRESTGVPGWPSCQAAAVVTAGRLPWASLQRTGAPDGLRQRLLAHGLRLPHLDLIFQVLGSGHQRLDLRVEQLPSPPRRLSQNEQQLAQALLVELQGASVFP